MKDYFIYDGRAEIDVDNACVLEVFEAKSNRDAIKYYNQKYKGIDSVLCNDEDTVMRIARNDIKA